MAATKTVAHLLRLRKSDVSEILTANPRPSIIPRHGVVTLFGYGIQVRVDRGHLILEDGIGADRRYARFPRIGHGLKRLVVIGADGMISLAALRWLADQNAAFVMLERDGSVLATTGPVRNSDVRLRRAQALAIQSGVGLSITRDLITQKLQGQEKVARNQLHDPAAAQAIARFRSAIGSMNDFNGLRNLEAQAGLAYWAAWRSLSITFPRNDLPRVPDHWRIFQARTSPITSSPRLATTPLNAILNYLYAILEAEARLAAAAMGLDPGLGFLHLDTPNRDSLAADLMEPVRPQVDAYLLDWISREPFKRDWFFEQSDGNCRLMGPFAAKLSETAQTWYRAVAPLAESMARTLWLKPPKAGSHRPPATHLTQERRRNVKGAMIPSAAPAPRVEKMCRICGKNVRPGRTHCEGCAVIFAREQLIRSAEAGRIAGQSAAAQARRSAAQSRLAASIKAWDPTSQPDWLTEDFYRTKIVPLLTSVTRAEVVSAIGVSIPYAADVRNGKRMPHPRHWVALANLVGVPSISNGLNLNSLRPVGFTS